MPRVAVGKADSGIRSRRMRLFALTLCQDMSMLRAVAGIGLLLTSPAAAGERLAGLAHVLDGDTIVVAGIRVRLKGVAAPEVEHLGESGESGGEAAKAFMAKLVEGEVVVCDLTREDSWGRRVGWCYRDGQDVALVLIRAGLARDCPRFSGGTYAADEQPTAKALPFPAYCVPR